MMLRVSPSSTPSWFDNPLPMNMPPFGIDSNELSFIVSNSEIFISWVRSTPLKLIPVELCLELTKA